MESCQTCHSELPNRALAAYINPCCSTPICARCITQNPRLRCHVPCLRCGDAKAGHSAMRGHGQAAGKGSEWGGDDAENAEVQFTIGDDDDDGEGAASGEETNGGEVDAASGVDEAVQAGHHPADSSSGSQSKGGIAQGVEPPTEVVEVKHRVARGDTLMSIARRYAADPHDLLKLNGLPATALSTNPRILQTRRELIISRRTILLRPGSTSAATLLGASDDQSSIDVLSEQDAADQAQRQAERIVKRFQLLTKTEDPAVGRVYLALAKEGLVRAGPSGSGSRKGKAGEGSAAAQGEKAGAEAEGDDGDAAFHLALASYESDLAAGTVGSDAGAEKLHYAAQARQRPKAATAGKRGNEQDALDAFYSDEEWEVRSGGPSRRNADGASVGGKDRSGGWPVFGRMGGAASSKGKGSAAAEEGKRWMVSPSTGPRAVEAFQKA